MLLVFAKGRFTSAAAPVSISFPHQMVRDEKKHCKGRLPDTCLCLSAFGWEACLLLNFSNSQQSQSRGTESMQISGQTHPKHTGQKKDFFIVFFQLVRDLYCSKENVPYFIKKKKK